MLFGMCGRFTVTTKDTKKVADRFQADLEKALGSKGLEGAGGRFNGLMERRSSWSSCRRSTSNHSPGC